MCTTTGIEALISFRDSQGTLHSIKMRRKSVSVVCPIFFTRDTANTALLKNLVNTELKCQDSKIFTIPTGLSEQKAFDLAVEAISGRSIHPVRKLSVATPFVAEGWYYGTTKVKKMQMVIRVSVREETRSLELFVAAPVEEALTGMLAELGHEVRDILKKRGMNVVQVTNVTIRDSVLHKTSLLFGDGDDTETDTTNEMNVIVEDSVIHNSAIGAAQKDSSSEDQ